MWSFFKKNKENKTEEISPEQAIESVLVDIALAIKNCEKSLSEAQKNKEDISNTYFFHQEKSKNWHEKAIKSMKNGNEIEAKKYLEEKNMADIAIKNYKNIYESANQNVKKLEIQLLKMNTQLVEIRAKKTILVAQLSQAQTQKEITQKLQSLQISTDEFENQIVFAQAENFIEQDHLASQIDDLEQFEQQIELNTPDLKALSKEIEEENNRKKEKQIQNQMKKFENFFDDKNKNQNNKTEKKDTIKDFFEQKNESKQDKKIEIDEFFNQKNETKNQKNEDKNESKQDKKNEIDEFFNQKNEDKNQKINEFFNNKSK
ncbi:MAG: hypothetical protein EAZ85_07675 [Bacteroidetes bacterium]|nr:MAG: hypothetical protein EAZ85_07675 [Bacteroidota bacterium]TAG85450.1 MAG: hypothetical protein EAZ20_15070 [Bacteroidota bacterium]